MSERETYGQRAFEAYTGAMGDRSTTPHLGGLARGGPHRGARPRAARLMSGRGGRKHRARPRYRRPLPGRRADGSLCAALGAAHKERAHLLERAQRHHNRAMSARFTEWAIGPRCRRGTVRARAVKRAWQGAGEAVATDALARARQRAQNESGNG